MATRLVTGQSSVYLNFIGCANSFFTGALGNTGNLQAVTGANTLRELYDDTGTLGWSGAIDGSSKPSADDTGQYLAAESWSAITDADANYECRRNASLITSSGRLQLAISSNNGQAINGGDARFCIYYPSEDFNQEVISIEYNSTDAADITQGNNIANLLNLTRRMKDFVGNNGPTCDGTANTDLYSATTSIFKKGCLVTWESGATAGNAIIVGPGA